MAALHAGIPVSTPISTVNRQCSSGLAAVNNIAALIRAGQIDIGIGAGVESMTFGYNAGANPDGFSSAVLAHPLAEDCLIPMGLTSENVAADFSVPRTAQDAFAARSFQKAARAQKEGRFAPEIVPIDAPWVDPKTEKEGTRLVDFDDGVRDGVTAESLAKLRPAFAEGGTTHAGGHPIPPPVCSSLTPVRARQRVASLGRRRRGAPRAPLDRTAPAPPDPRQVRRGRGGGRAPADHGRRAAVRDPARARQGGHRARGRGLFRDQRGVREPGRVLRARARHRRGPRQRLGRRDRHRAPARVDGRTADRDGPQHRQADGRQDLRHEHVHRLGHGHGRRLRLRAVSASFPRPPPLPRPRLLVSNQSPGGAALVVWAGVRTCACGYVCRPRGGGGGSGGVRRCRVWAV
ncbi:hypothetical protein AcV5_002915 [Taiwanofungus camphoratus]|nr:hypothetical protein AcV5_002915 [Antrodia cinnamomea]